MDTIKRLNQWAEANRLNFKAELGSTGKGGKILAGIITCDAVSVRELIQTDEFPVTVSDLAPNGDSILKQLPGSSGMFRFKLPLSKFESEATIDLTDVLSGAKLLGSNGPSSGECNWVYPHFANANHTGIYAGMVLDCFALFTSLWDVKVEPTVITVTERCPTGYNEPGGFIGRLFTFESDKQDDTGKSGSQDGYTATHVWKVVNGLLLEFAKTGVPSKTGRGGTTS